MLTPTPTSIHEIHIWHAVTKLVRQFVYSPFFTMRYHPNAMTTKISAITAYTMIFSTKQLLCSIIFCNYENVGGGTKSWWWYHQRPGICEVDPRKQGRAMPHNLATIQNGTGDGWVIRDEFNPARRHTGDNIYSLQLKPLPDAPTAR